MVVNYSGLFSIRDRSSMCNDAPVSPLKFILLPSHIAHNVFTVRSLALPASLVSSNGLLSLALTMARGGGRRERARKPG